MRAYDFSVHILTSNNSVTPSSLCVYMVCLHATYVCVFEHNSYIVGI